MQEEGGGECKGGVGDEKEKEGGRERARQKRIQLSYPDITAPEQHVAFLLLPDNPLPLWTPPRSSPSAAPPPCQPFDPFTCCARSLHLVAVLLPNAPTLSLGAPSFPTKSPQGMPDTLLRHYQAVAWRGSDTFRPSSGAQYSASQRAVVSLMPHSLLHSIHNFNKLLSLTHDAPSSEWQRVA